MTTKTYEVSAGRLDAHDTRAEHETLTSTLAATRGELRQAREMLHTLRGLARLNVCAPLESLVMSGRGVTVGEWLDGVLAGTALALPSTEAAVRAGIEAANTAIGGVCGNNTALVAAHAAIRALDPSAIAAQLERR